MDILELLLINRLNIEDYVLLSQFTEILKNLGYKVVIEHNTQFNRFDMLATKETGEIVRKLIPYSI